MIKRTAISPLLLALVICGCAGGSSSSASSSSNSGIAAPDTAVLSRIDNYVTAYNDASNAWSAAYKRGVAAFLHVQRAYTAKMTEETARIRIAIVDIRDPNLNALMNRLGETYARETAAIREVDDAAVNRDLRANQRGIQDLQAAAQVKLEAINQLARRFPSLRP